MLHRHFPFLFKARPERRRYTRTPLRAPGLAGQLYRPADHTAQACTVTEISAGGARVTCQAAPLAEMVVVHVEGFGRFEARTTHAGDHGMGLCFAVAEPRRARLADQIAAFLRGGLAAAARRGVEP